MLTQSDLTSRVSQVIYSVPKWITFWREFPIVEATVPGAVFYNITLTGVVQTVEVLNSAVRVHYIAVQTVAVHY